MEPNLLPCPFCGGEPKIKIIDDAAILLRGIKLVCSNCGASKMVESNDYHNNPTQLYLAAHSLWNSRIPVFQWTSVETGLPGTALMPLGGGWAIVIADGSLGVGEYLYDTADGWKKHGIPDHFDLKVTRWMEMPT